MSKPLGSVIVLMEPTTLAEDEFNDWYDHEHIPDRRKVEGCLTIERFICTDGWPRSLCLYDYQSLDVLKGAAYRAIHDTAKRTPWTVRILARVQGFQRHEANQIYPGDAIIGRNGRAARLIMGRISNVAANGDKALIGDLSRYFQNKADVLQWRLFRSTPDEANEYWLCVEFGTVGAVNLSGMGLTSGHLDLANMYAGYWRNP